MPLISLMIDRDLTETSIISVVDKIGHTYAFSHNLICRYTLVTARVSALQGEV